MHSMTTRQMTSSSQPCCARRPQRSMLVWPQSSGPASRTSTSGRSAARHCPCRAVAGLSTYPLMERLAVGTGAKSSTGTKSTSRCLGGAVGSHAWLASCVRHIVASSTGQHVSGPTLQLVFSEPASGPAYGISAGSQHRFQAVPISQAVADDPQSWNQFASHVRSSGATGLVLVRPIASPEQHCVYAASASPSSPSATSSPSPRPSPVQRPPSSSIPPPPASAPCRDPASATATSGFEGQVGNCCDAGRSAAAAPQAAAATTATTLASGATTRYYGLVVQGSCRSETDGCWVLKTTSSDSGVGTGLCACTHFCLTRVCLGQPLYEQLRDAWLVQ